MKVSVIVSVYNAEAYLPQALDSICAQSLHDIEIICVDDGSTDHSIHILSEYAVKDKRIKVLQQPKETNGAAAARNLGISHARGEFLSILDSDDFFEPDMLVKAYQQAQKTEADIVIFDGCIYDELTHSERKSDSMLCQEYLPKGKLNFSPKENADVLFLLTLGAAWNCLFRRSFIEMEKIHFQSYHHADDLGFVYLAFACAKKISILNEKLIHYRKNISTSQAANIDEYPETGCKALLALKEELIQRNLYDIYKKAFAQKAMDYVLFYLRKMRSVDNYKYLYKLLQKDYLKELGVLELKSSEFHNPYWGIMRDAICDLEPDECLFRQVYQLEPFQKY